MEIVVEERGAAAVACALDNFRAAQDRLVEAVEAGGLGGLHQADLLGFARDFEQTRNRAALIDHRLVHELQTRGTADVVGQPTTTVLLSWLLRLSRGEAARRVRAAESLGERVALTGEILEPLRPSLAAAQRAGQASPEQVDVCLRALGTVDHRGFDPADLDTADELLAEFATTFAPRELRQVAQQVVDRIDPDGTRPQEDLDADRRHLAFRRLRDGMYSVEGRLTGSVGAKLQAVLGPLARPRLQTLVLEDGREIQEDDPRHHGQRTHDALEEVCDRLLRSGTLPDAGGTPATVIVTIAEDDLVGRGAGASAATARRSPQRRSWTWPTRPRSTRPSSARPAWCCSSAGAAASPPLGRRWHWWPGTAAAASPAATGRRSGANATTCAPGSTAAVPISTT